MTQYLFTGWMDFSQICHKYSSCEWTLLKRLSRSEVKTYDGEYIHYDDVVTKPCFILSLIFISTSCVGYPSRSDHMLNICQILYLVTVLCSTNNIITFTFPTYILSPFSRRWGHS